MRKKGFDWFPWSILVVLILLMAGIALMIDGHQNVSSAGSISRPSKTFGGTSFVNGVVPDASDFNGDIDTIYAEFNGSIDNDNVKSAAGIVGSKISPAFTTDASITTSEPCVFWDENDQSGDARRWYACVVGGIFSLQTRSDAAVLQNTWAAINRSTGQITLQGGSPLLFEGATDDAFETTLAITDPTADRTITFPDETGTISFSDAASQTFTGDLVVQGVHSLEGNTDIGNAATDTVTITATIDSNIVFEGSTADGFETTFSITDPTADRS